MFLKTIELFGFKSFADRTRIEFADGISALLGPNGCGKSNVVDAIKWVLGEQATKSLRAERMEDIIFNGTDSRKAVNVAEVTLTLENDAGILPIDTSEISVRRRLYRSGESEYFINGQSVRLKELRELFYDTGIGKSAYSIMEQGKIDQVLSNKPEERRTIFEEAAAITKYKIKGREAERRLERTEENMRQVDGILGEVKRSYDTLKKQADKTLKYRELRDQSFELELDLQLLRLGSFVDEKDKKSEQLTSRTEKRDAIKKQIDGINDSLEENLDLVNSMEARLMEGQKKLYGIELEKGNRDSQVRMLGERIRELEEKVSGDMNREKGITQKIASLETDIGEQEKAITSYDQRISEVEENITQFESSITHAGARIQENEKRARELERDNEQCETEQEEIRTKLRTLTDDIVTQLDQKLKESGYSARSRGALEEDLHRELEALRVQLEGRARLFEDAETSGTSDPNQLKEIISTSARAVSKAREALTRVAELFAEYRKNTPAFLDEFLAPEGIITQKRELDEKTEALRERVRKNKETAGTLSKENRELSGKIEEYRKTLEEMRMNRVRMSTQRKAVQDAVAKSKEQISEQERLQQENKRQIEEGKERVARLGEQIADLKKQREELAASEKQLQKELAELEKSISSKNKDLMEKERKLKSIMDELGKTQAAVEQLQMSVAETNAEIRNIYTNFEERHSRDLREYESRMLEISIPAKELRDKLSSVREEQRQLGSVNLMAVEEFAEIKERYEFLSGQLEDLRKARTDLIRVTQEIQEESAELFTRTYEKIKKNFHTMFRRLFGGGRAELKLLDTDNVLESGIEIYAQPPGKKLENIALLSGGERSLTAVALLFATYVVKPSPFCLLDEIDAALDESNVGRFANMLMEFGESSQFIIITHNKKTVTSARTLLGVTMEDPGVSKVVAIRMGDRDAVHA